MPDIYISMPRHNGESMLREQFDAFWRAYARSNGRRDYSLQFQIPGHLPTIKNVIFNPPATIVMWSDGTKTVVKCENEDYDPEKGLAMAISKKALGNKGSYFNEIKKWTDKKPKVELVHGKKWLAYQRLQNALGDKKATKADLIAAMHEASHYLEDTNG